MDSQEPESFHSYMGFDRDFQVRGRTFIFAVVLFAALVVITSLFLYSSCRKRHRQAADTSDGHQPSSQTRGLDPSTIKSFPIVLHKSSSSSSGKKTADESECCVCLGVFGDGEKVKVLPNCRHCFHSECVDKWLSSQASCPLCRSSLLVDSPV